MPEIHQKVKNSKALSAFYVEILGMQSRVTELGLELAFNDGDWPLILSQSPSSEPYQHSKTDRYWKIGITLPNVDLAYEQLSAKSVDISEPRQFRDIGYMCHLADPEGFQIELLQHTFEGLPRTSDGDPNLPLGGGAQIGQVTLRTTDIEKELAQYRDELGMKLLSIQPVTENGFDLYFLAFTDEEPPNTNLKNVDNRPWLWQRPYTTLEIQHYLDPSVRIGTPNDNETGFAGIEFNTDSTVRLPPQGR